jgi:hypothetical protein
MNDKNIYSSPEANLNNFTNQDVPRLEKLDAVAKWQKYLVYTFLVYFIFSGILPNISEKYAALVQLFIYLPVYLAIIIFNGILCWQVYSRIVAVLMVILGIIPIINFLVVLAASSRATSLVRKEGFKVGFLGANRKPIQEAIKMARVN